MTLGSPHILGTLRVSRPAHFVARWTVFPLVVMLFPFTATATNPYAGKSIECDLLVVGGSLGGCAAAIGAARLGEQVWMTEECDWIGGQITAQGVSALDEHQYIETFGGTAGYYELRKTIRRLAREKYHFRKGAGDNPHLNPGGGWVSRLCFEPTLGLQALCEMMKPQRQTGRLRILTGVRPVEAQVKDDRIVEVTVKHRDGWSARFHPRMVIDATDLGDLLPIANIEYVVGAEPRSETEEPHAHPGDGNPDCQQSFTFTFAVEWRPGENHTIPKPESYETFRDNQPYTFQYYYGGNIGYVRYHMFETGPRTYGPFWTYRRLVNASILDDSNYPNDIAMINWSSNDYRSRPLIGAQRKQALEEARHLSLGFLYWLQTEAPRDDGGKGYPELLLRKDIMGTKDGLSQFPYVRESRRIRALRTIVEQDIAAAYNPKARARFWDDSVGLGFYSIDIHGCGAAETGKSQPTRPFQIPMGALIPARGKNLLAGCKNIGTTHITNGAYRLHPVEWNIGESAGALAHFALQRAQTPADIWKDQTTRRLFQQFLIKQGIPLYWFVDVPIGRKEFAPLQRLAAAGIVAGKANSLKFNGNAPVTTKTATIWLSRAAGKPIGEKKFKSRHHLLRSEAAHRVAELCETLRTSQKTRIILNEEAKKPDREITRFEMVEWIDRALNPDRR